MNTTQVEISLINHFNITRNTIVNNVTEISGLVRFESDLLILSKNRYATCIEIKVSKSDLKNDLKKNHISRNQHFNIYFGRLKYFYYAVPKKLEVDALNQIPEYAGLLVVENFRVKEVRKPKFLFKYQWSEKEENQLMRLGCMRILNLKSRINQLEIKIKTLKTLSN